MNRKAWLFLVAALGCVMAAAVFALCFGALQLPATTIVRAVLWPGGGQDEVAIRSLRLPRVILAATVGASLASSGVLLQGITRNPLGSPDLFGVLSGTEGGAVVALYVLGSHSTLVATIFAVMGGAAALALVFVISRLSRQSDSVIAVALAGFSVGVLMEGITGFMIKWRETEYAGLVRWAEGSIGGRDPQTTLAILPFIAIALTIGLCCTQQLNVVNLGDETAKGLGLHTHRLRLAVFGAALILTAAAVIAAGPIGFVGLIAPHIARAFTGPDYRFILPGAALVGSAWVIIADLCARTFLAGVYDELPIGALTDAVGAPAVLFILRRQFRVA